MTIGLLYWRARRCADVREYQPGTDMPGQFKEIAIIPCRFRALIDRRNLASAIPADAKSVTIGRLHPKLRMEALIDQRVFWLVQQLLQEDGGPGICEPTAHLRSPLRISGGTTDQHRF
jgi:hypothetical protein